MNVVYYTSGTIDQTMVFCIFSGNILFAHHHNYFLNHGLNYSSLPAVGGHTASDNKSIWDFWGTCSIYPADPKRVMYSIRSSILNIWPNRDQHNITPVSDRYRPTRCTWRRRCEARGRVFLHTRYLCMLCSYICDTAFIIYIIQFST